MSEHVATAAPTAAADSARRHWYDSRTSQVATVLAAAAAAAWYLWYRGNPQRYFDLKIYVSAMKWWAGGHPLYDFSQPEVADQWGTANQINEFVARKSFNEPDPGLFTAPPV